MPKSKPKATPKPKKLPGKNPSDPIVLAKSVLEAVIGEPLNRAANKKKRKPNKIAGD